jgi:hypothetical protein
MFQSCRGSSFQVNNVFKFPVLTQTELNKTNVFNSTFYDINTAPMQTRTAASIINGNPTPFSNKGTFTNSTSFSDRGFIPTNWGGGNGNPSTVSVVTIGAHPASTTVTAGAISGSLSVTASVTLSQTL